LIPPRLIPVLLVDRHRRVVKTVGFKSRTYVGDPFNIIRLFNEKEVDELCVLDIDATADGRSPDFSFLSALASECFMPLSYGGGISTIDHARALIQLGIEKLVLRTYASDTLISEIASEFGSQAVIGCLDYREVSGVRVVGRHDEYLSDAVSRMIAAGVGELILQSIDRDGARTGMDLPGIADVSRQSSVPVIALGGAGDLTHLEDAIGVGADAAASGSAFCFIGRLRAVLVTYPDYAVRQRLMQR